MIRKTRDYIYIGLTNGILSSKFAHIYSTLNMSQLLLRNFSQSQSKTTSLPSFKNSNLK